MYFNENFIREFDKKIVYACKCSGMMMKVWDGMGWDEDASDGAKL